MSGSVLDAGVGGYQVVAFFLHPLLSPISPICPLGHAPATPELLPALPASLLTPWPAFLQPSEGGLSPGSPQFIFFPPNEDEL